MLGAVITAQLRDLGYGTRGIDESFLSEANPGLDDLLHARIAESILVDCLEPGPAQIDLGSHHVDVPVPLGVMSDLSSKIRELVAIRRTLVLESLVRELIHQYPEEMIYVSVLLLGGGSIALPRDELEQVMYEFGIGRGEGDVLLRECPDHLRGGQLRILHPNR